jgi:hypothetical protein
MPLPVVTHDTLEVDGVTVRGLTRGEALRAYEVASGENGIAEFEITLIAAGTETSVDEVRDWYHSVPMDSAGRIVDAVRDLTGLGEDEDNPKVSSPLNEG